jgi:hypothetical protein
MSRPAPERRARERLANRAELGVTASQRQPLQRDLTRPRSLRIADGPRLHRLRLALDGEWLDRPHREQRVAAVQHVGRRVDRAGLRLRHHARREVHRVAHHRISTSVARPDVAGEYRAAMHADAHRNRQRARQDRAQREQNALFIVAHPLRCAAREDQLPAVGIHVRREERDAMPVTRCLRGADDAMQRGRGRVDAVLLDQCVGPFEAQECDRDRPVLRRAAAAQDVLANRRRQTAL